MLDDLPEGGRLVTQRNTSPCGSLAHGARLEGAALSEWLDTLQPGSGSLREAIEVGTYTVRFGVNDFVISFADWADQSRSCRRDTSRHVLEHLLVNRDQLDVEPATALAVWVALKTLVIDHHHDDPTHADVAAAAGVRKGTAGRALQSLRRIGLVEWQHQVVRDRQIANAYRVLEVDAA